ncbi:MAG: hypothetical protein A2X08_00980 [Bacteroidetes bacterium GWA2_32_17]|nr:MAG: hypothetical protein A2X08_00980 [Bacteroidetes bacterium GWA2_32_17]
MKKSLLIIFIISTVLCYGQTNKYNDWFDFNLKGSPKIIKEVSVFSLTDFLNPVLVSFLNSSVKSLFFIDEYYFDSLGVITTEFHKSISDTTSKWQVNRKKTIINYKDSIIKISYIPNCKDLVESCREKKKLVENEFVYCKITDCSIDTVIYERDKNNMIIKIYDHFIGTDFQIISVIENELNENGDIKLQKRISKNWGVMSDKPSIRKTITTYKYIYDSYNNWILKLSIIDKEINMVTQREIKY